jgi:hypothetical protein
MPPVIPPAIGVDTPTVGGSWSANPAGDDPCDSDDTDIFIEPPATVGVSRDPTLPPEGVASSPAKGSAGSY